MSVGNLSAIAAGVVSAVNDWTLVTVQINTGSSPSPDGTRSATYATPIRMWAQVQPTTWKDLQQLDSLNVEGVRWKIYLNGEVNAVVRPEIKGGDLIVIESGPHQGTWLVAQLLEQWGDWCCAAVTLQNGS